MKFALGDQTLELLPTASDAEWTYTLGSQSGTLTAVEVEPGTYSILLNGKSYDVRTGGTWAEVAGRRTEVQLIDPRNGGANGRTSQRSGQATLKAPMPGKVVRILVKEGDAVEAAQGLIVVEAMKMQNEMKAPRAGIVRSIKTSEGKTVTAGEALLVIE